MRHENSSGDQMLAYEKEERKMMKSDFFGGVFLSSPILKGTFAGVFFSFAIIMQRIHK